MLKGKKIIIFDMDGTLIDSVGIWNDVDRALIEAIGGGSISAEEVQLQRDEALRQLGGKENPYMEYCSLLKDKYGSDLSAEEIHTRRYQIANEYLVHVIDYKKDAETVLKRLKETGMELLIATTTKKSNMDIYRTKNINICSKARLDEYFTRIYTREDVKEIKPSPEIYFRILKEFQVSPKECLVFEDSLIGIEAAKAAGIEVAVIYDRYSDHERSRIKELADYQIQDYRELLDSMDRGRR